MTYELRISPRGRADLGGLAPDVRHRIMRKLDELRGLGHRHPQAGRLLGVEGPQYRFRVGDWRIRFAIRDDPAEIVVLRVGHRSQIYKG